MVNGQQGFALLELLAAVVIFGLITFFVLFSYTRVSEQLFMSILAYETALSFRQAQSYGVSVHEFNPYTGEGIGAPYFDAAYGIHFGATTDTRFVLFADADQSKSYNAGSDIESGCVSVVGGECVSVYRIERGNRIEKFCGVLPTDGGRDVPDSQKREECNVNSLPAGNPSITYLDVTFLRPNPDAVIRTNQSGVGERYKAARVYLISRNGVRRIVEVMTTGQISIK